MEHENNVFMYSEAGEWHRSQSLPNQDAVFVGRSETAEFYAVADGVSQCRNSKEGAEIACRAAAEILLDETAYIFGCRGKKAARIIVAYIKRRIRMLAAERGESPGSFSSTLCFVCRNRQTREVMTLVLGDSRIYAIYPAENDSLMRLSGAEEGISTMTIGAEKYTAVSTLPSESATAFLLCTDGAWRLMKPDIRADDRISEAVRYFDQNVIERFFSEKLKTDDCSILMVRFRENEKSKERRCC